MLQLQLKDRAALKLPKKAIFLIKLSFFCVGVHALGIALFFLIPENKTKLFLDTTHTNNAAILFVPLLKTNISQSQNRAVKQVLQDNSQTQKKIVSPVLSIKKESTQQKKAMVIKQSTIKKVPLKTPSIQKKIIPVPKAPPKKIETKIKKEIKPEEPKKKEKINVEQPKPIIQEPQKKVEEENKVMLEPKTELVAEHSAQNQELQIAGRDDLDLIVLSNALKQDIMKIWKRPANIPTQSECRARVSIHKDGTRDVVIEKSSHAMALDICVRNFLLEYNFPPEASGKDLSIIF